MCTLTFIPKPNDSFILTSNRDEAPGRATIAPAMYQIENISCLFPKDEVAGGTWLGVSEKKRLICLLNGGFEAHLREDTYRMSRGIVVKKLLVALDFVKAVEGFNFNGIEPFTLIAIEYGAALCLFELVWDGLKPHCSKKPLEPTIWSSSLLYTPAMREKREQWFLSYLETQRISVESILHFHKTAGEGDVQFDLIMDRGFVKTKAITQVINTNNTVTMKYVDLQNQKISETIFS